MRLSCFLIFKEGFVLFWSRGRRRMGKPKSLKESPDSDAALASSAGPRSASPGHPLLGGRLLREHDGISMAINLTTSISGTYK